MVDDAFQILLTMFNNQVADWSTETKLYFLSAIGKIFAKSENVDMSLKNNLKRLLNDSEPEVRQVSTSVQKIYQNFVHHGVPGLTSEIYETDKKKQITCQSSYQIFLFCSTYS